MCIQQMLEQIEQNNEQRTREDALAELAAILGIDVNGRPLTEDNSQVQCDGVLQPHNGEIQ